MLYTDSHIDSVLASANKLREQAQKAHGAYYSFPTRVPEDVLRAGNLEALNQVLTATKHEYSAIHEALIQAAGLLENFAGQLRNYNEQILIARQRYDTAPYDVLTVGKLEYELFEIAAARRITEGEVRAELDRLRDRAPLAAQAGYASPSQRTEYQKLIDALDDGNNVLGQQLSAFVPHEVSSFITNAIDSFFITGVAEGIPSALYMLNGGALNPVNAPLGHLLYGKTPTQIAQEQLGSIQAALSNPAAFASSVLRLDQFRTDPAGWAGQMAGLVAGALITRGAGGANDLATVAASLKTLPARFRTSKEFSEVVSNDATHYGIAARALHSAGISNTVIYTLRPETQALFAFDERTGGLRFGASPSVRGYGTEDVHRVLLHALDGSFKGLVYNNKAIDGVGGYVDGVPQYVSQSKSINPENITYMHGNALYNKLSGYAEDLAQLQEERWIAYASSDGSEGLLSGRSLSEPGSIKYVIEIPSSGLTNGQVLQFKRLADEINFESRYRPLDLIIIEIPNAK